MATKGPGRPPEASITQALRRAAERALVTTGHSRMSIDRLATEVGTTRQSFYRRYPTLAHLVFEIVRDTYGAGAEINTGSLDGDLLAVQRETFAMLTSPMCEKNLTGVLEAMRVDPSLRDLYERELIQPRRERIGRILAEAAARGELAAVPGSADVAWVCDLLSGPLVARALFPGARGMGVDYASESVAAVVAYLEVAVGSRAGVESE